MSESRAEEDYIAFDSIRNRFGGARKTAASDSTAAPASSSSHQQKKVVAGKRWFDPRSAAPPLVPLVEESDLAQEEQFGRLGVSSPVKGKWKHSNTAKVYGPDFDSLETASVASGSSAYSSRSESSSTFSGPLVGGSLTELSDASSTDTCFEYDIKTKIHHSRIASLRASFERARSCDHPDIKDPDEVIVQGRTKAWNKFIGEWIFDGVQKVIPSSPVDRARRISNEVRVPTPTSTPVYGSTENLFGSGSRTSLLSSNDESEEEQLWNMAHAQESKLPLGRFINSPRRRPHSASSLPGGRASSRARRLSMSNERSSSEIDLVVWEEPASHVTSHDPKEKPLSPLVTSSTDPVKQTQSHDPQGESHDPQSKIWDTVTNQQKPETFAKPAVFQRVLHASEPVDQVSVEEEEEFKTLQKITPAKSGRWLEAYRKYRNVKNQLSGPQEDPAEERSVVAEEHSTADEGEREEQVKVGQRVAQRSTKWRDAYQKYRAMRTDTDSHSAAAPLSETPPASEEEASSVEQRAKVFGGMQRKPLKRSQSFQIGSYGNRESRRPLVRRTSVVDIS